MNNYARRRVWCAGLLLLVCLIPTLGIAGPLASLQSYTGIWNMPTARVLPDWNLRFSYGYAEPYRYYGGAIGLLDRLEIFGQFTEVSSIKAFEDFDYGNYKDRSAGFRLVLAKEDKILPQVAFGALDITGTGLFAQRYLVATKQFGNADITFGLGQGVLAGEFPGDDGSSDTGNSFLFSNPLRPTKIFGGIEYDLDHDWTLAAEYSPIDRANQFGYRDRQGNEIHDPGSDRWPINIGIKYHGENWKANLGLLRGDTIAAGIHVAFPMKLNSMLGWQKTEKFVPGASLAYQAETSENDQLSLLIAEQLFKEGYFDVKVSCSDTAVWIEFYNSRHLEVMRAFGHIADVVDALVPARIATFYLNQTRNESVVQSLKLPRESFRAFMDQRLDSRGLQAFSDFDLYRNLHWQDYRKGSNIGKMQAVSESRFSYELRPRIFTFLNNRSGFFKHKGVLQIESGYRLWKGARLNAEIELVAFNQYDDLVWEKLEKDSVRTDMVEYQQQNDPQLTQLAFEQHLALPWEWRSRFAMGMFERAYAGFGVETFRLFNDGLWGIGFEAEAVRKRAVDDNFRLRNEPGAKKWFYTGFINLYAQIWPSQGIEGGLKIGRFLAGDPGVSIELRRSFKHFTVGAWYTKTDTSIFSAPENRNAESKGVFISFPLALFKDRDVPGNVRYTVTSFTSDQGQTVAQPSTLYPMDPWDTPVQNKREIDKMRLY